jgi:hypothetical protein
MNALLEGLSMFTPFDDDFRTAAKVRRERGGSTVRVYRSTRAMLANRTSGPFAEIVHRCKFEMSQALFDYCDAVFPDRRIPVDLLDTF